MNIKSIGKRTIRMRTKVRAAFVLATLAMLFLLYRVIDGSNQKGEHYRRTVLSQYQTKQTDRIIPYRRGNIVDRNGTILATSIKTYNIILDPKLIKIRNEDTKVIDALNTIYGYSREELESTINSKSGSNYVRYARNIGDDEKDAFQTYLKEQEQIIRGVWFEEEYIREYPQNALASDVIGFTTKDGVGLWGLEKQFDNELDGENGREFAIINSDSDIETTIRPTTNGNTVITTLDQTVQYYAEQAIAEYAKDNKFKSASVTIMNPNNGEILAMANYPNYDLNNPTDLSLFFSDSEIESLTEEEKVEFLNSLWRNESISDTNEPGSTMKPFTIAAALEEGIIAEDQTYYCDGYEIVGGWRIECAKREGHGLQTLAEVVANSCNDALMQIAKEVGISTFSDYNEIFGFGQKTNIDLIGEASAETLVISKDKMTETDLAVNSFGQSINMTSIQLITSFSSLINGGYVYQPHFAKQIVTSNGSNVKTIDKTLMKQTISRGTSEKIKEYLVGTVDFGTGKRAQLEGYEIGGKTATAEKLPRGDGKHVISFIGFAPADNPQVIMYVSIDEPEMSYITSTPAMLLFKEIFESTLPYLDIYPTTD